YCSNFLDRRCRLPACEQVASELENAGSRRVLRSRALLCIPNADYVQNDGTRSGKDRAARDSGDGRDGPDSANSGYPVPPISSGVERLLIGGHVLQWRKLWTAGGSVCVRQ